VISGFLQVTKNWRWSFYVFIWLAGPSLLLLFTVPETLPSRILIAKARRIRKAKIPGYENVLAPAEATGKSLAQIFKVALTRPWVILFDPISFLIAIYVCLVYGLLYMLFSVYPIIFQMKRGWNAGVGSLPLLAMFVAAGVGGAMFVYDSKLALRRQLKGIQAKPEVSAGLHSSMYRSYGSH
jgi:MFS family permease